MDNFLGEPTNPTNYEDNSFTIEDGITEIYKSVIQAAEFYSNERIQNYLDPCEEENESEDEES